VTGTVREGTVPEGAVREGAVRRGATRRGRRRDGDAGGRAGAGGFTLVEVLMAVMLLAVGLLALAGLGATALRTVRGGSTQTVAAAVAQSRFDSLASVPCDQIALAERQRAGHGRREHARHHRELDRTARQQRQHGAGDQPDPRARAHADLPVHGDARMPVTRRRGRHATTRRTGFTLIEMLVAAALGLLIMTAASAMFVGQLRAYLRVRGISAVQRDLRLGIALLPMDLRGASRRDGDFISLAETSLEVRATVATSVICQANGVNKTTLILPPPGQIANDVSFTTMYTQPQPGDTVKVLIRTAAGGVGDKWLTAAVGAAGMTTDAASTAGRLCTWANGVNPRRSLPLVWSTVPPVAELDSIKPGMPIRVLRRVRYALYDAGGGRWYLGYSERQADGSWTPREPIAGPFDAGVDATRAGVRFAYFDTAGVALAAPVVATRVGRIDITLRPRTRVRAGTGPDSVVARDSALVRVALRNRI
jgi:prepilin-type N-terminal cleavage/methylation domain-containing protein